MNSALHSQLQIKSGPSGRAMAEPMDIQLVEALHQHLTMERNASAQYFAASIWFAERELRGFAKYFRNESESEQKHASTFADYLIARGQNVVLEELAAPSQSWESIEQVFSSSFLMEADVTTSLHPLMCSC